MIVKAVDH